MRPTRFPDPTRDLCCPPTAPSDGHVVAWDAATKRLKLVAPGASSVPDATTTEKGTVELATDGETAAGVVVQGNDARLSNARTPTAHTHATSEVTGLDTALSGKQAALGFTPENAANRAQANGYASLGADGKVPAAQLPAAGADPWAVVKLATPFSTTSTTAQAVTGLKFTPQAGKTYVVYGGLLVRASGAAATGPRPGINWPSGLTAQGGVMYVGNSAVAQAMRVWGPTTANQNAAGTGLPDTTNNYLATFEALVVAGASPSGDFQITLASETSGTGVTMAAGSYLMYREL